MRVCLIFCILVSAHAFNAGLPLYPHRIIQTHAVCSQPHCWNTAFRNRVAQGAGTSDRSAVQLAESMQHDSSFHLKDVLYALLTLNIVHAVLCILVCPSDPELQRKQLTDCHLCLLKELPQRDAEFLDRQELLIRIMIFVEQEFSRNVLLCGPKCTGKTAVINNLMQQETLKGRPVLFAKAETGDTVNDVMAKAFRWNEMKRKYILPAGGDFRMRQMDLRYIKHACGLPLIVIDNVERLPEDTVRGLQALADDFNDSETAAFIFVTSGGSGALTFQAGTHSHSTRCLHVGDLAEEETVQYLTQAGRRTEDEAREIYRLVGGRFEMLKDAARSTSFDFDDFREKWFSIVNERIELCVGATGCKRKNIVNGLQCFIPGSEAESTMPHSLERAALENSLLDFRVDTGRKCGLELDSKLVRSCLEGIKSQRCWLWFGKGG